MKYECIIPFLTFLYVCSQLAFADVEASSTFSPDAVMETILPLSQQPQITISTENRQQYLQNKKKTEEEVRSNLDMFKRKTLPWISLLAAATVLVTIILIRASPTPQRAQKDTPSPLELQNAAVKELAEVEKNDLKQNLLYNNYFSHLDHAVRIYLEGKYHIDAPKMTTEELQNKVEQTKAIDKDTRLRLLHFLNKADQVKYAHYTPSLEECVAAINEARKLLS